MRFLTLIYSKKHDIIKISKNKIYLRKEYKYEKNKNYMYNGSSC